MYLIYNEKGDIVKVLSIREPYASLIKMKIKTIETRSFKTNYRGELYIHASLSKSNVDDELSKLVTPMYGKIICKCKLVDCVLMTENYVKEIKEKCQWNINVVYMKRGVMPGFWKVLKKLMQLKLKESLEFGIFEIFSFRYCFF